MKNPKLKDFTYSHYLKVTSFDSVKLVIQGWYRLTHDGLVLTFNGDTYKKGWKEKGDL
tara:strand:+ start:877 stop:1050 length:174 start_codon:yes stop_codon:yes gene_type:complete